MEMQGAMMINVGGERVALSDLVETWQENGKLNKKATTKLHGDGKEHRGEDGKSEAMAEYYDDLPYVYVPYGTTTFADLKVVNEAQEAITSTRILTAQLLGLIDGIMYSGEIEYSDKSTAIKAVTEEYAALVVEQMDDIGEAAHEQEPEGGLVKLTESMGSIVEFKGDEPAPGKFVPLHLNVAIIEPGWGNTDDNHFYPREMLQTHAGVFLGAKMRESQHLASDDQNTKSWVSTVKEITGFTETGAPIARCVIHDRSFAERLRALAHEDMIGRMECSILANGKARAGKVDGKKGKIVESITEVAFVDWVMRAGAGGRALNIAEKAKKETAMTDKEKINAEESAEETPATDVTLAEDEVQPDQKPEPVAEQKPEPEPEPELLSEVVQEVLDSTNLPNAAKAWLSEVEYADKGVLAQAIEKAVERVKAMTGSGNVVGMGEGGPAPSENTPFTEEEKRDQFIKTLEDAGVSTATLREAR